VAAYAMVEVDVTDPEIYAQYREQVPAVIAAYGGKYLIRGGATETVEGDWQPKRLVLLEFPTMERLRAFYDAPEYAPLKDLRLRSSRSTVVICEGV
jgi:uncharacterized protein (DUF1330 family)